MVISQGTKKRYKTLSLQSVSFHFPPEAGVRDSVGDKLKSLKKVAKNQDWYANVMLFTVGSMMPVCFYHCGLEDKR